MNLTNKLKDRYVSKKEELLSIDDYLALLKTDTSVYATPAERMLKAIGEPEIVETSKHPRLSRIHLNKSIRVYKAFEDFYGMENTIEQIVAYFRHSAQGLEEKKQILYLLGPVGSAKSSLAERLKQLMEKLPIYVLVAKGEKSPIYESPLGLFNKSDASELGIPERHLSERLSPWALKRLEEFGGDISQFKVAKVYPSKANQTAIAKTEPGDENNQDISALVGKTDVRKLAKYSQNDTDSYSYSGGLNKANNGLLEFVEMFKAPIKVLHPLLTATQEGNYNATEGLSPIPFDGIILAHSNESEWQSFRSNKNNEAFLDRVYIVKVPYTLRKTEEAMIYKKLIRESDLANAPCSPHVIDLLAFFDVLSRVKDSSGDSIYSKVRVYDGENWKEQDPKTKAIDTYRLEAGVDEGMTGISTRFAFKTLSKVFNYDTSEIAANPVHLFHVLNEQIKQEQLDPNLEVKYLSYLKFITDEYKKIVEKEIQTAYLESADEFGQNKYERYIKLADLWLQDQDYCDNDTGEVYDRQALDKELSQLEKAAGISNPKDFRDELVKWTLREQVNNKGKFPNWKAYAKIKEVIEKSIFAKLEDMLPIISFNVKDSAQNKEKHQEFVKRFMQLGYTAKQTRIVVEWFNRTRTA